MNQNTATGSTRSRPSLILTPRIVRFGITTRFQEGQVGLVGRVGQVGLVIW